MKISNELKTGAVVIAAILAGVFFFVRTTDFTDNPYRVKVNFNYADGVKQDSIVKLSGIEIGRVESVKFNYEPETKIEVTLLVSKSAKIHEDGIAYISTSGMIGDAFIGITPGTSAKPYITDGATLASEDPIEMRKLMKKADAIATNLDATLEEVKKLASNVNSVVTDNRSHIDSIVINLEGTTQNFKEFSADIKAHPWKILMKGKE